MGRLVVLDSVRDELIEDAREGAPAEVCGILAGESGEYGGESAPDERFVEKVYSVENTAINQYTRYEIDPREQLAVMEQIEESGREIVGFYHSHPAGPSEPSETDVAEATWPGKSYVIVFRDGSGWEVGSWNWTGEKFVREKVRVVE